MLVVQALDSPLGVLKSPSNFPLAALPYRCAWLCTRGLALPSPTGEGGNVNDSNSFPWPAHTPAVQVGDARVDLRYRRLSLPHGDVELSQRVFDVLLVFLSQPHC